MQKCPDFGLLQDRTHVTTPTAELLERVPVQYVVFDLLHRKDRSLLELPYGRRRELLEQLDLERPGWRMPANFTTSAAMPRWPRLRSRAWWVWLRSAGPAVHGLGRAVGFPVGEVGQDVVAAAVLRAREFLEPGR